MLAALYDELHGMPARHLRGESAGHAQ